MVTTPNSKYCIVYWKFAQRVDVKFSHRKNYLWGDGYVYVMGYYSAH